MSADVCFRVNTPDVTHEVIDGEAVIINLVTGNYYSLHGEGAEIWTLLDRHTSLASIIDLLASRYETDRVEVENSVRQLVLELREEGLITPWQGPERLPDMSVSSTGGNDRRVFRVPVLHKFTDMQELLILDPIHEVDASGWPHKRTEESS